MSSKEQTKKENNVGILTGEQVETSEEVGNRQSMRETEK